MATKNYYLVLGVPSDETSGGIRSAFRDLARKRHPDVAGPESAAAFRELVDAYRVLSDPTARRRHDANLSEATRADPATATTRVGRGGPAEPFAPLSVLDRYDAIRPSADALFERLFRNFTGRGVPKSEHAEPLLCDVRLSREESLRGGRLPIRLPVARACRTCRGTGRTAFLVCRACGGDGSTVEEVTVALSIPPGVRPGAQLDVPLERVGIRNVWLRVRIAVAP